MRRIFYGFGVPWRAEINIWTFLGVCFNVFLGNIGLEFDLKTVPNEVLWKLSRFWLLIEQKYKQKKSKKQIWNNENSPSNM